MLNIIATIVIATYEITCTGANLLTKNVYIRAKTTAPTIPATQPSIDLFGLILLNLCFPNLFPTRYANISVPHEIMKIYHI